MKIFLSYPSEQLVHAKEVHTFLTGLDIEVWFDKESLVAGQDWSRTLKQALREADMTILLCSKETVSRIGVIQREIKEILNILDAQPLGDTYLIPLRTEDVHLPPEIAKYQYINKFDPDWKLDLAKSIQFKAKKAGGTSAASIDQFIANTRISGSRIPKQIRYDDDMVRAEAEYFNYPTDNAYWELINSKITSFALGGLHRSRLVFGSHVGSTSGLKNWWSISSEEFYRSGDLVSHRFFVSWYGGGAHPNRDVSTMNFGGPKTGQFELREIFSGNRSALELIRDHCEGDVANRLGSKEPIFPLGPVEEALWAKLSAFNFDASGLMINFSAYAIACYAAGEFEVRIPWPLIVEYIDPVFEGSLGQLFRGSKL